VPAPTNSQYAQSITLVNISLRHAQLHSRTQASNLSAVSVPYFRQRTPTLSTGAANAATSPDVLNQWHRFQRCSCAFQSLGTAAGVRFAIRLLIGTGVISENAAARTCIARAIAAKFHANLFRYANENSRRKFNSVEPAIQNGITLSEPVYAPPAVADPAWDGRTRLRLIRFRTSDRALTLQGVEV
jgi:hypothetical protein